MKKKQQKLLTHQHLLCADFFKTKDQHFWAYRPHADKWNSFEHLAHLAAYQHTFYDRIFQILETENPVFTRYDGQNDINFVNMQVLTPKEAWQELKDMRRHLINVADKLSKKDLKKTATHPIYGTLSLEQWIDFFILHESHHIFAIFQLKGKYELHEQAKYLEKDFTKAFTKKEKKNKAISFVEMPIMPTNLLEETISPDSTEIANSLKKQKEELIEVYNSRNEPTGEIVPRSEVHQKGLWHRTMHCWVIYRSKRGKICDYVVFQRRSAWKDSDPNKFDTTAAGHYTADKPIAEQKFKEIEEELGLQVNETDLNFVGVRINVEDFEDLFFNHEFQDVYFWVNDTPLQQYKLQTEEVSGLIALEINKGLELFLGEVDKVQAKGIEVIYAEDGTTSYKDKIFTVKKEDFGQTLDNYFAKALLLAKKILAGEKYVKI
jgi:isopentenyldiphosphate isomerase